MKLYTDYSLASKDPKVRAAAKAEVLRTSPDADPEDIEQWVDDLIDEWCDEYQIEIDQGRHIRN